MIAGCYFLQCINPWCSFWGGLFFSSSTKQSHINCNQHAIKWQILRISESINLCGEGRQKCFSTMDSDTQQLYMTGRWSENKWVCKSYKKNSFCMYFNQGGWHTFCHTLFWQPGPVFIKPLRITLKNTAKNWLKWELIIGSKLPLKVSYESSQS